MGGGWGTKCRLHCETKAGDSQLGEVTDSSAEYSWKTFNTFECTPFLHVYTFT